MHFVGELILKLKNLKGGGVGKLGQRQVTKALVCTSVKKLQAAATACWEPKLLFTSANYCSQSEGLTGRSQARGCYAAFNSWLEWR